MSTTSRVALATYIHALLQATDPASPLGRRLIDWLQMHHPLLGIDFAAVIRTRSADGRLQRKRNLTKPLSRRAWDQLCAVITAQKDAEPHDDIASANLAAFAGRLRLTPVEVAILRFTFLTGQEKGFDRLCDLLIGTKTIDSLGLLALCLGVTVSEVWEGLTNGDLARLRLVQMTGDGSTDFCYYLSWRVLTALRPPHLGLDAVEQALIGQRQVAQLDLADYAHMAPARDFVRQLLLGALRGGLHGVNILLHGAPGTGKTEFCRAVAAAFDCDLYAVGEANRDGEELPRDERLDALRLADRLAARRGQTLLLFDEMEDILQSGDRTVANGRSVRRAGSKVFFNRLLEGNEVPILWTTNAIGEFDPAFLRRMTFILEMKRMPVARRAGLWLGAASRHRLALSEQQAQHLARRHAVAPAIITKAVDAVVMAGGSAADIDFVMASLPEASRQVAPGATTLFQADLANADADLDRLGTALTRPDAPKDVSFCFYGPPGTGKSAFARELAQKIELEPLLKKGSDLLSPWLGETEQKLAAAFAEAREDQAFLIIDEAENFLWQRGGASRSWEVSMVNELLVQMETHRLPFACTTNHLEALDPAALRRFTFKVKFDFMTRQQARLAFRQFFGSEAPSELGELRGLTPGDFAVVAKKLRVLSLMEEQEHGGKELEIVRLLALEAAAKNLPRPIGF